MAKTKRTLTVKKALNRNRREDPLIRNLEITEIPETGELEIRKRETKKSPAKSVRFPADTHKRFQMMPEDFANVQNAIEAVKHETRQVEVFADSIESCLGYDSLLRVMNRHYASQVAFYRSAAGGCLPIEEARNAAYRGQITEDEAIELFDRLMRISTEHISFSHLAELSGYSPAMAQNLWETVKREAALEFETGHRAAGALEPADYMTDAWNRASYLGLRESLIEEYQPKGGIELTMIDAIAQSWLMLQHWTEESVRRSKTRPREENQQFQQWKQWNKEANPKQWDDGFWDIPNVSEQSAVEHAAQMADRWQRMYFRAIRNLRDWRRYKPAVTINNPGQVNIASDGGNQINVNTSEDSGHR